MYLPLQVTRFPLRSSQFLSPGPSFFPQPIPLLRQTSDLLPLPVYRSLHFFDASVALLLSIAYAFLPIVYYALLCLQLVLPAAFPPVSASALVLISHPNRVCCHACPALLSLRAPLLVGYRPLVLLHLLPADCIVHLTRRRLVAFVIAAG